MSILRLICVLVILIMNIRPLCGNPLYNPLLNDPLHKLASLVIGNGHQKQERKARLINKGYNLVQIFFPGKFNNDEGHSPRRENCLPTFKPTLKMREKLRQAVSGCVSMTVKKTWMFGREAPCEEIRDIIVSEMSGVRRTDSVNRMEHDIITKRGADYENIEAEILEPKEVRPKRKTRSAHMLPSLLDENDHAPPTTSTAPATNLPDDLIDSTTRKNWSEDDEIVKTSIPKQENNLFKQTIIENEFDSTQYQVDLGDLDGDDDLSLITEILGGNLNQDQKVPSAVFFPILGSKSMFEMDKSHRPAEGEGDKNSYKPLHLPTSSKQPVREFLTHLMLRKLGEYMQSCVINEMDWVNEAGSFETQLFKDFLRMGFEDENDADLKSLHSIIDLCDNETSEIHDNNRAQIFSALCFEPMIADFCLLRQVSNKDDPGLVHDYNSMSPMPEITQNKRETTTYSSVEEDDESSINCTIISKYNQKHCPEHNKTTEENTINETVDDEKTDTEQEMANTPLNHDHHSTLNCTIISMYNEKDCAEHKKEIEEATHDMKESGINCTAISMYNDHNCSESNKTSLDNDVVKDEDSDGTLKINPRFGVQSDVPLGWRRIYLPDEIGLINIDKSVTEDDSESNEDSGGSKIESSESSKNPSLDIFTSFNNALGGASFGFG